MCFRRFGEVFTSAISSNLGREVGDTCGCVVCAFVKLALLPTHSSSSLRHDTEPAHTHLAPGTFMTQQLPDHCCCCFRKQRTSDLTKRRDSAMSLACFEQQRVRRLKSGRPHRGVVIQRHCITQSILGSRLHTLHARRAHTFKYMCRYPHEPQARGEISVREATKCSSFGEGPERMLPKKK